MFRSAKKAILVLVASSLLTGTAITGPSIFNAATKPTQIVTIQSFAIKGQGVKAYCSVVVKHSSSSLSAPIPAPIDLCNILTKGQEVKLRGQEIITGNA